MGACKEKRKPVCDPWRSRQCKGNLGKGVENGRSGYSCRRVSLTFWGGQGRTLLFPLFFFSAQQRVI